MYFGVYPAPSSSVTTEEPGREVKHKLTCTAEVCNALSAPSSVGTLSVGSQFTRVLNDSFCLDMKEITVLVFLTILSYRGLCFEKGTPQNFEGEIYLH
jgi:hypothetical protein